MNKYLGTVGRIKNNSGTILLLEYSELLADMTGASSTWAYNTKVAGRHPIPRMMTVVFCDGHAELVSTADLNPSLLLGGRSVADTNWNDVE